MIHSRAEFDIHAFVSRITTMSHGEMITETDTQRRAAVDSSYGVRGANDARQLGSERFIKQLNSLLWYLQSDGLKKPPFAAYSDLYAYRPIAERLVARGAWTADALELLPKLS